MPRKGDYYRYIAEYKAGGDKDKAANDADAAYKDRSSVKVGVFQWGGVTGDPLIPPLPLKQIVALFEVFFLCAPKHLCFRSSSLAAR